MAFIPVPDTVEVEIRATFNNERVENTLYFLGDPPPDAASVQGVAEGISAWWVADVMPNLSADYVLNSVYARDLSAAASYAYEYVGDLGEAGGVVSQPVPGNVSWAIKFITGVAGRSYRGRNYIAGLTETYVIGNTITIDFAATMVEKYELLLSTAKPAGYDWVVASRYAAGAPRVNGVATPVTGVSYTDLFVDSMRRRLAGRGA